MVIDMVILEDGSLEEGWISVGFPFDTPLNQYTALDVIARILPPDIMVRGLELASTFGGARFGMTSWSSRGMWL
ncbi:hypothetical protein ASF88_18630 [Leifsonia sp. Leaf336]|nr:hypothetical protein ASF88_18630 [Leifsonia sp. Leaf336]